MKIEDDALTARFRRRGKCRWCGKVVNLCAAHIWAKGHGGGGQIDIPINLVALGMNPLVDCECHTLHHNGERPIHEDLLALSAFDHDADHEDIEAVIMLIQRMPPIRDVSEQKFLEIVDSELNFDARNLARKQLESFKHLLRV